MFQKDYFVAKIMGVASYGFALMLISSAVSAADLPTAEGYLQAMQKQILAVATAVKPKVVHIEAILKVDNMSIATTGSGFVTDSKGHILTNNHVVEKAEKVTVIIPGHKKKFPAEIIGTDKQTDLAVLKVSPPFKLTPPQFGNSSEVNVGDWVVAIGNPYGLDGTVSFGIISAVQRNLPAAGLLNEFIQTDAMIDFGSSGGPLTNIQGEVIGVNSRGQGRGIGFTIPINLALEIRDKLIREGQVERAWLGVTIQPLDRDLADALNVPGASGVIINQVHEGSAAQRAGLKPGDILTAFDGQSLEAENEREIRSVTRIISQTPVGKKVKLATLRQGKKRLLKATITRQPQMEGQEEESQMGFNVQEITKMLYIDKRLQSKKGVYVSFVESGSVADEAKLLRGDIIQKIDRHGVDGISDFQKHGSRLESRPRSLLSVLRGNNLKFILLKNDRKKPRSGKTAEVLP